MALDFPSSPTNNQVYENYIYNSTSGAWQKLPGNTFATTAISDTPPVSPANGDLWWNSADGKFYIYYSDGSSAQWVSAALPAVAVSDTPPAGYDGQMWLDSTDGSMYVYYTDPGGASSSWIGAVSRSGGILQVVSTTKTSTFSTASTSLVDVPGLSVSITPRSTGSKVLLQVSVPVGHSADLSNNHIFTVTDSSDTILISPDSPGSRIASFHAGKQPENDGMYIHSFSLLHSPSTTSTYTYKVRTKVTGGTGWVNRSATDGDNASYGRGVATITAMEVAG